MDDEIYVIGVVECRRAAIEDGLVEVPLRRSEPPDEIGEFAPVFVVAGAAAFRGEIVLVPPLELGLRRQRHPVPFAAANQVAADGYKSLATLRPERRDYVGRARSPIAAGDDRFVEF